MGKKYRKIEFEVGKDIDSAIEQFLRHKDLVYGLFNGHMLYSDIDDIDSAYRKITGKSKTEFMSERNAEREKYKEKERRYIESIPYLTDEWINKGKSILDSKYHELWEKCVPIRLGDLYKGMELGACLEIVTELNNGCELDKAKAIIESQGHSGMSFSLVCSMVQSFCDRGLDFVSYVRY
jgi:hypothetical protein